MGTGLSIFSREFDKKTEITVYYLRVKFAPISWGKSRSISASSSILFSIKILTVRERVGIYRPFFNPFNGIEPSVFCRSWSIFSKNLVSNLIGPSLTWVSFIVN